MPKKPTEPFGYLAFSKSGRVRAHRERLPDSKIGQETEIAARFAMGLRKRGAGAFKHEPLGERGHDFRLIGRDRSIDVQATEIVSRDYWRIVSRDDYVRGDHPFTEFVTLAEEIWGIDTAAKNGVLLDRIRRKLDKKYAAQALPLWLLVWTVCSDFHCFWYEGGEAREAPGVEVARVYLRREGAVPFSEIWFMNVLGAPFRIWPEERAS